MAQNAGLTRRAALRCGLVITSAGMAGCGGVAGGGRSVEARSTDRTALTPSPTPSIQPTSDRWPSFQFDERNTGDALQNVGPTGAVEPRWEATATNSVVASPVVVDGMVFVASTDTLLYAFRWDTGDLLGRFPTAGIITATPAVADGSIYVASRDDIVYALPTESFRTSEFILERWRHDSRNGIFGSLTVADGTLYAGNQNGNCFALDLAAGVRKWITAVGDFVDSAVAVADGLAFVSSPAGWLYALDATNGSVSWRARLEGGAATAPTVIDETVVIGTTEHHVYGLEHRVYAFDATDGSEQWVVEPPASTSTSAAVADGTVYVGTWDGTLHAFSAATGEERFAAEIGNAVSADPAVVSGTVYAGTLDGHLVGIDGGNGTERLRFQAGAAINSAPAIVDGTIVFGTDSGRVYALAET